jgi:Fe-S cluster assembly protein SufD
VWDAALAAQGVIFMPLAQALVEHTEVVEQYFGKAVAADAHKYRLLHSAIWQDGAFLYIPKNVAIEAPLRAIFHVAEGTNAIFPHTIVVLERGASASFIQEYRSADVDSQVLIDSATELFLNENAQLRYIALQALSTNAYQIDAQRAIVGRGAKVEWTALNLGARLMHLECETSLEGNGSQVDWTAATLARAGQTLLTAPWLRHLGVNTEGHMNFKTVVKDDGYSTFDGMIKIDHDSRGTVSRLEEHALHLSPKARTDSIPGLIIDTNDVAKAGHASTSGQVDEDILFYMRSRGISRADAVHMIVMGFFEPVFDRIPSADLREEVATWVEEKI